MDLRVSQTALLTFLVGRRCAADGSPSDIPSRWGYVLICCIISARFPSSAIVFSAGGVWYLFTAVTAGRARDMLHSIQCLSHRHVWRRRIV